MSISTHVLDAVTGVPASGITVALSSRALDGDGWDELHRQPTDDDGRIADLTAELAAPLEPADYRLTFETDSYFGGATFYPEVVVTFRVVDPAAHLHVPLLLSPYAYSTYRGS